ncbi:hypothetical protein MRX96_020671 [Rhipicephalus microplus]
MSVPELQPPPSFLPSPGHPAVPWYQWKQAFQTYMVASGASDLPADRRKAILLTCLGLEGHESSHITGRASSLALLPPLFSALPNYAVHRQIHATSTLDPCEQNILQTLVRSRPHLLWLRREVSIAQCSGYPRTILHGAR